MKDIDERKLRLVGIVRYGNNRIERTERKVGDGKWVLHRSFSATKPYHSVRRVGKLKDGLTLQFINHKVLLKSRGVCLRLHPHNTLVNRASKAYLYSFAMAPSTQSRNPSRGPPSSTTLTLIKILSIVRLATGAACLIAPRFTCAMHDHHVPAEHIFLVRMMGIREGVNGGLLLTAKDKERADGGRRCGCLPDT